MKTRKRRRMQTEDARFLRDLMLHILERVVELESATGQIQYLLGISKNIGEVEPERTKEDRK